jgi:hypothetical protein
MITRASHSNHDVLGIVEVQKFKLPPKKAFSARKSRQVIELRRKIEALKQELAQIGTS